MIINKSLLKQVRESWLYIISISLLYFLANSLVLNYEYIPLGALQASFSLDLLKVCVYYNVSLMYLNPYAAGG